MWTFIKEFFGIGLNSHVEEQKKPVVQSPVIKQVEDKLVEAVHAELTKTKKPKAQPKPKAPKKNAKK